MQTLLFKEIDMKLVSAMMQLSSITYNGRRFAYLASTRSVLPRGKIILQSNGLNFNFQRLRLPEEHEVILMPIIWNSAFLFTKRTDVLAQRLVKSRNREIRVCLDFFNRPEIWQAPQQQRCRDVCQMSERHNHCNIQYRGLKTSRDLTVRPLKEWRPWIGHSSVDMIGKILLWMSGCPCEIRSEGNVVYTGLCLINRGTNMPIINYWRRRSLTCFRKTSLYMWSYWTSMK